MLSLLKLLFSIEFTSGGSNWRQWTSDINCNNKSYCLLLEQFSIESGKYSGNHLNFGFTTV